MACHYIPYTPTNKVHFNFQRSPSVQELEPDEEIEEIGEPRGEMGPALYLASQAALRPGPAGEPEPPVYSPYLGLAVEPPRPGFSLKSLWEVLPST